MKKVFSCILITLLLLTLILPVYASFKNLSIVDKAGYLTQSELTSLSEELDKVREKYDFDAAIYTESDMTSGTAEASADDIYDYQGYGTGENDDGFNNCIKKLPLSIPVKLNNQEVMVVPMLAPMITPTA